jgi:hypothetical protein
MLAILRIGETVQKQTGFIKRHVSVGKIKRNYAENDDLSKGLKLKKLNSMV